MEFISVLSQKTDRVHSLRMLHWKHYVCVIYSLPTTLHPCTYFRNILTKIYASLSADSAIWENSRTNFLQPVGRGTEVTLVCDVCANPNPIIEWFLQADTTSLTTGENLTITNIQDSNYGNYTCVASNTIQGQVYTESFTYSLVLGPGPPGPVVNLSVVNVTSVSVSLQWTSSWDGDMTASFMLQYREVGSSESTVAESGINWVDPGSYTSTTVTSLSDDTSSIAVAVTITTNRTYI